MLWIAKLQIIFYHQPYFLFFYAFAYFFCIGCKMSLPRWAGTVLRGRFKAHRRGYTRVTHPPRTAVWGYWKGRIFDAMYLQLYCGEKHVLFLIPMWWCSCLAPYPAMLLAGFQPAAATLHDLFAGGAYLRHAKTHFPHIIFYARLAAMRPKLR